MKYFKVVFFSGASLVAQLVKNPPAMWETWVLWYRRVMLLNIPWDLGIVAKCISTNKNIIM